jgi:hypothetical protein
MLKKQTVFTHQIKIRIRIRIKVKSRIRVRINVMRIRNTANYADLVYGSLYLY